MLVVLFSGTSAQRFKKILASKKIPSEIIQTPKSISEGGCTYSLRINGYDADHISSIASDARINVKGIFEEEKTGKEFSYKENRI